MIKFELYQIDPSKDKQNIIFSSYQKAKEKVNSPFFPNKQIYEKTYEGKIDTANDVEDLFMIFNTQPPQEFNGRSMSVSDVVKIIDSTGDQKPGNYYCDSIGFKEFPLF